MPAGGGDLHALAAMQSAGAANGNRVDVVAAEEFIQSGDDGNGPAGGEFFAARQKRFAPGDEPGEAGFFEAAETVGVEGGDAAAATDTETEGLHAGILAEIEIKTKSFYREDGKGAKETEGEVASRLQKLAIAQAPHCG